YSFYVHNRQDDRNTKPFLLRSKPLLLNQDSPFYMTKEERMQLLWYFVEESGYYIKAGAIIHDLDDKKEDKDEEPPLDPAFPNF
ncbi:MAG: hypothetical protein ACK4TA_12720, partial [Saprospiraceae bacterium]